MRAWPAAVAFAVACGGAPRPAPPRAPAADVRGEIEQAETAERARRHDVARAHYERAVAAARDPASIWFARREYAETLATWGEYAAAITHLEAALAVRPADAGAWHDLGLMRFHEGNAPGAVDALERSIRFAPKDYRPRRTLAVLHWKAGDLAKQRQGLGRLAISDEANAAYARAAAVYRDMLALDLPDRLRTSTEWAIAALTALQHGELPPAPPAAETRPH